VASHNLFKDLVAASKDNITASVIAAIAAFVPLIVYLKVIPLTPEIAQYWSADVNYDFFSFYKMTCFLILTLISTVIFCIGVKHRKIVLTKTWIYAPVGVYALTLVLSTIFAKHKDVALYGFPDRHEGVFVILAYLLVFIIVLNIAQGKGALKLILAGLLFSAFTASLIGLLQFIGKIELFGVVYGPLDFFKTSLGRALITPSVYRDVLDLNFNFPTHVIYTTLYNTNFVGSFMGMALMLPAVLFILIFSTENAIRAQFSRLNVNTAEKMATSGTAGLPAEIKDVKISSSVIFYSTANADLRIKLASNNLEFFTGNGIQLRPIYNADKAAYVFNEQKYSNFKLRFDKNNIIYLFYGDAFIQVAITRQGFKFFDERRGCTEMRKAASWGFKDSERLATNRGYLWSRTIP
jgi:hypothetical protein